MNKKKVYNQTNLESSSKEKLNNTFQTNLNTNISENITNAYLPKMRTDYAPSDESVESGTGVDFPINMPNPATDPIVSNNIANAEFNYTEDMLSSDD